MSKNNLGIEASPLNLSLTGSNFNNQSKINNRSSSSSKKPPAPSSYRSYISTSSTNLHADVRKGSSQSKDSARQFALNNVNVSNNKNNNINDNKNTKSINNPFVKKNEEKENKNSITKESNIFAPMSVRSSTDEIIATYSPKKSEISSSIINNNSTQMNDLDFFFDIIANPSEKTQSKINSNESDILDSEREFNIIKPLKDEKLKKLKSSVDNLRRELEVETRKNENESKSLNNQIEEIRRRHQAATKIQKWYRRNLKDRINKQKELENMFNKKKVEMKKKLEKDLVRSSSSFAANKKPTLNKTSKLTHSVSKPRTIENIIKTPRIESPKIDIKKPAEKINIEKLDLNFESSINEKLANTQLISNRNVNTVESLLTTLDKLDKETSSLLNLPNGIDSNRTSEKINSILSYLDEAAASTDNSFVPRAFKPEYDYDVAMMESNSPKTTTKSQNEKEKPPTSTKNDKNKQLLKKNETTNSISNRPVSNIARTSKVKKEEINDENQEDTDSVVDETVSEKLANHEKKVKASIAKVELNDSILTQKLEIEEKNRTITMLEKALHQQRELTLRHTKEADREMQIRLEAQKTDYESTIQRHLGFIDQLIDDKKVLSEKCEKLVKELKDMEKSYSDKLRTTEEKFKYEIQKMKDTFEAAEKLRREKWIEEKTKKIKEMTVKGLEPEIQALITKHKNEIKSLKAIHDAELLQADERAAQRYIRITEELRENFEREKESSIQKEKDLAKQRYEKSLEEEEKSFLEQRRRLYAEIEEEKNRIAEQGALQRRELDRLRKMLEENNFNSIETIRKEYATAQAELERKHQAEIDSLKEKLQIEKESWEQNYMKKQENWIIQKERELKDHVKKDRDKEIELLIQRLEAESTTAREEVERASENRIKRVRDKYETELREVEKIERETMERYNSIKSKYNELEGEYERLKVIVKQKEKDFEGIKKLTDTLQDERNRLADVIRQDFTDRIIFTEEENKRIKQDIAEIKSRHQYELDKKKEEFEKMQKEKENELNTVHEKIKNVIAKKDETYNQLKQQYEAAAKRADHLEGLLEQQRTLMIKKQANNS